MMNNNKILTVSYGTFSCTLEGFDDSFDTMKAIAEYFRDLASDDRYFGAEPPQPDAEMLAKIAEREVARRVEAHEHEGRIMLKAHEDTAPPVVAAVAAAPEAPVTAPEVHAEAPTKEQAPVPDAPQPPAHVEATEDSAAEFFADSPSMEEVPEENEGSEEITVEAFTSYIPAVDAEEDEASTAEESVEETVEEVKALDDTEKEAADDTAADETVASDADEANEDVAPPEGEAEVALEDIADTVATQAEQSEEADEEITATEQDDTPDTLPDGVITAEDAALASKPLLSGESFTDKLQRIREVVSRRDDAKDDDVYDEDLEAPAEMGDFAKMPAFEDDAETSDTSEAQDDARKNQTAQDAAFDIESALAADDETSDMDAQDEGDELDTILDRIEAAAAEDEDADADETAEAALEVENIFDEPDTEDAVAGTEEVSVDGRILKINRAALDAALKSGELEEYDDDGLEDESALSDDENELQSDLAAEEDDVSAQEEEKPAARETLPQIDDSAENDVSRLMAEADQHMDEPEGKTRRSAFAHLRAAVAARFADRSMDTDAAQAEEEETEAYRSDLAEVVKPRRPGHEQKDAERSDRSATARPSPLKLVAEQRIDSSDLGDVAPRRVAASATDELILEEDTGFANYADERGANSLPEVLEAAAAYLCHVEGAEHFSRPQLMSRVKQADCGEFSREDGLRAFGQLLRTGKIEKIKGGRFVASEAIGFKPGHRAAG